MLENVGSRYWKPDVGSRVSNIMLVINGIMRRKFTTNEFYHVFNRGVDKRKIFLDKSDQIRFVHDLYEFNDINPAKQFSRSKAKNVGSRTSNIGTSNIATCNIVSYIKKERKPLVKIHSFILMSNHYHLLVEQIKDGGLSLFMRKLNTGYTNSFNTKHKRKGHLLQGPFGAIHVDNDIHFGFLICYLHANVLDLWKSNWKKEKLTDLDIKRVLKFLDKYRWSSHLDYSGIKNFSSVIDKKFLLEFFDGARGYKEFFIDWLKQYKKNTRYIKDFT